MCTGRGAVAVLCSWEGNRKSSVALVVRHRLCDISTYGLSADMAIGWVNPWVGLGRKFS